MAENPEVSVELTAKTGKFKSGMKSGQDSLRGFRNEAKTATSASQKASGSFIGLAKTAGKLFIAMGGVGAVTAGFVKSVSAVAKFETALSDLESSTGATASEMADMETIARRLGDTTNFSALQAVAGLDALANSALNVRQSMAALDETLTLAKIGNVDVARSAEIVTDALAGFNLEAGEAQRIADVLAVSQRDAGAGVDDMGAALNDAGPLASSLGISLEETAAALSILTQNGIDTAQSGSSLTSMMEKMIAPSDKLKAALAAVGLTTEDVNPKIVGLETAVKNFANFDPSLLTQIFGVEEFNTINSLIESVGNDALPTMTEGMKNAKGAADDLASASGDTLVESFNSLKASLDSLFLGTGSSSLGDFFKGIIQEVDSSVEVLQDGVAMIRNAFAGGDLGKLFGLSLQIAGVNFLNMLARAGGFVQGIIVSGLAPVIGTFKGAISTVSDNMINAFKLAGNFLYEKATAAALAVLKAVNEIPHINLDGIVESVSEMNKNAKEGLTSASDAFDEGVGKAGIQKLRDNIMDATEPLLEAGRDLREGGDGAGNKVAIDTSGLRSELNDIIEKNWRKNIEDATEEGVSAGAGGGVSDPLTSDELDAIEAKKKADKEAKKAKEKAEREAERAAKKRAAAMEKAAREAAREREKIEARNKRLRETTAVDSFRSVGGGGRAFNVGATLGLGSSSGVTGLSSGATGPLGAARVGGGREITVLNDIKGLLQQIRDRISSGQGNAGTGLQLAIEE